MSDELQADRSRNPVTESAQLIRSEHKVIAARRCPATSIELWQAADARECLSLSWLAQNANALPSQAPPVF